MVKYKNKSLQMAIHNSISSLSGFDTLNYELTVSFTNYMGIGDPFRLTRKNLADGDRLMRAYLNFISRRVNYGMQINALAIPEFTDKDGMGTVLHYHCFVSVEKCHFMRFWRFTSHFTYKLGLRHFSAPISYHISEIDNVNAYLAYSLKTMDDEYPLDRILLWGDLDEGRDCVVKLPAGARWKLPTPKNVETPPLCFALHETGA